MFVPWNLDLRLSYLSTPSTNHRFQTIVFFRSSRFITSVMLYITSKAIRRLQPSQDFKMKLVGNYSLFYQILIQDSDHAFSSTV